MNKRVQIDMWYGNAKEEADGISITFYPNSGEYLGNIYKEGKSSVIMSAKIL